MPIVVKLTQKPSTPLSNEQLGLRFATESEAYADAAMLLENSRFHSARYYLFCHAFELILKSFILSAGEDQSKLFGVGHRLNEALAEATRLGYSPSDAGLASIIDWLHPFHEGNHFRYARGGYQMLPTAENILTAFKAAHLEIAPLARTAYLKKYPSRSDGLCVFADQDPGSAVPRCCCSPAWAASQEDEPGRSDSQSERARAEGEGEVTIPSMDRFKEKFSVLPIEVIAVIAINIFLASFGYAAAGWWLFIR